MDPITSSLTHSSFVIIVMKCFLATSGRVVSLESITPLTSSASVGLSGKSFVEVSTSEISLLCLTSVWGLKGDILG